MSVKPCFPSHLNIARWTGLSKDTVNRTLQALKKKGVISWTKGNSYGKNNKYFIHRFEEWKINSNTTPKIPPKPPSKPMNQNRLIREYEHYDEQNEEILNVERLETEWNEDSESLSELWEAQKKHNNQCD